MDVDQLTLPWLSLVNLSGTLGKKPSEWDETIWSPRFIDSAWSCPLGGSALTTACVSTALSPAKNSPTNPYFFSYSFEIQAAGETNNRSAFVLWFPEQTNSPLSFWPTAVISEEIYRQRFWKSLWKVLQTTNIGLPFCEPSWHHMHEIWVELFRWRNAFWEFVTALGSIQQWREMSTKVICLGRIKWLRGNSVTVILEVLYWKK